jgi:23S rRNA pseudouridine2605 synthase
MMERLQKFLSRAGVASRRKAEEIILQGRVTVNGQTAALGAKVSPESDAVAIDGKAVKADIKHVYLMLHKPEGYITTTKDQFNRPTVLDLIPDSYERVYPIGRLDFDTSGLLILTNDGNLTQALTHPSHQAEKVYIAKLGAVPTEEALEKFRKGVDLNGYVTAPAGIQIVKRDESTCSAKITIHEGKNRQVRRMCEALGYTVLFLKRVAEGKLYLGDLPRGAYRELTQDEVKHLKGYEGQKSERSKKG